MRSVKEWVGATDDASPPPHVRVRLFLAADGRCKICNRKLREGDKWQPDHIKAICNGGVNKESNLQVACSWCHPVKTAKDVAEKSEVYESRRRHFGIRKPRTITRWRRMNGDPVFAPRER